MSFSRNVPFETYLMDVRGLSAAVIRRHRLQDLLSLYKEEYDVHAAEIEMANNVVEVIEPARDERRRPGSRQSNSNSRTSRLHTSEDYADNFPTSPAFNHVGKLQTTPCQTRSSSPVQLTVETKSITDLPCAYDHSHFHKIANFELPSDLNSNTCSTLADICSSTAYVYAYHRKRIATQLTLDPEDHTQRSYLFQNEIDAITSEQHISVQSCVTVRTLLLRLERQVLAILDLRDNLHVNFTSIPEVQANSLELRKAFNTIQCTLGICTSVTHDINFS